MFNTIMRMSYSVEQDQRIERCLAIFLAPAKPFSQEIRFSYFFHFKLIMCVTENVQAKTTFLEIFCVFNDHCLVLKQTKKYIGKFNFHKLKGPQSKLEMLR